MGNTFFEIVHRSSKSSARAGVIHTAHGIVQTPNFVGVGTHGTIKSLDNVFVANEIGLQLMFCNTYHMMVHPGAEVVSQCGGIHKFINRDAPIITDSGGFQIFSLAYGSVHDEIKSRGKKQHNSVISIGDGGVYFRSYRNGNTIFLSPEESIKAQKLIGADIIICFDELLPYHIDSASLKTSLHRTHMWEKRSLFTHLNNPNGQAIYAVIHGGTDLQLRDESCKFLTALDFDGFAIGGSLGCNKSQMYKILARVIPQITSNAPTHLLGIADIPSIEKIISMGIDTFDSSYPTKAARHGTLFLTNGGRIDINKTAYEQDNKPLCPECNCYTCTHYSRAYIHHLFKSEWPLAAKLTSAHNLQYMVTLMDKIRNKIILGQI